MKGEGESGKGECGNRKWAGWNRELAKPQAMGVGGTVRRMGRGGRRPAVGEAAGSETLAGRGRSAPRGGERGRCWCLVLGAWGIERRGVRCF